MNFNLVKCIFLFCVCVSQILCYFPSNRRKDPVKWTFFYDLSDSKHRYFFLSSSSLPILRCMCLCVFNFLYLCVFFSSSLFFGGNIDSITMLVRKSAYKIALQWFEMTTPGAVWNDRGTTSISHSYILFRNDEASSLFILRFIRLLHFILTDSVRCVIPTDSYCCMIFDYYSW